MGKDKLRRFAENKNFSNLLQPEFHDVFRKDFYAKGKWNELVFKNKNPIILELGCGKGEYTFELARKYQEKNFIGIDIKGARLWKGAKESSEQNVSNAFFLRTRIELINSFFDCDEVSEIWITFPDPHLKKPRTKKRLTSPKFLNYYKHFLKKDGLIHLKTDSRELHEYTLSVIKKNSINLFIHTNDLYNSIYAEITHGITTFYEKKFLQIKKPITYICFNLKTDKLIEEP